MKRYVYFLMLVLAGVALVRCDKEEIRYEDDFDRSFAKWVDFKASTGNSYTYVVNNSSWVGVSWQTSIKVTHGVVTQRSFKLSLAPGVENFPLENREWTEEGNELNSHPNSGAAETLTLDQIYEKARTEWLVKREKATFYFEAKNDGMLSECGFVPDGCMDDCYTGIHIGCIKP